METLAYVGAILGLIVYFPLILGILKGDIKQSFSTWLLWSVLDALIALSLFVQNGNYLIAVAFTIGSTIITILLFVHGQFSWSAFDTKVALLVGACMMVWYFSGPLAATIAGTIAMNISGIPQLKSTWRNPAINTLPIWIGFTLANFLSFLGGKSWTIEERFFPFMGVLYCLALVAIILARKNKIK